MSTTRTHRRTRLIVSNEIGLHARPAAMLVKLARTFEAEVVIEYDGQKANAKSVMGILALCVPQGAEVIVSADGRDAAKALQTIGVLFQNAFDEPVSESVVSPATSVQSAGHTWPWAWVESARALSAVSRASKVSSA